ncbi:MAG: hypothetical protein AB1918_12175 [Pseudomonadota bacterium]
MVRKVYIVAGFALVALGIVLAPLPGPGGLPVAMVGAVVILRHSPAMRKQWVRARRRWPRALAPADWVLRKLRRKETAAPPRE